MTLKTQPKAGTARCAPAESRADAGLQSAPCLPAESAACACSNSSRSDASSARASASASAVACSLRRVSLSCRAGEGPRRCQRLSLAPHGTAILPGSGFVAAAGCRHGCAPGMQAARLKQGT